MIAIVMFSLPLQDQVPCMFRNIRTTSAQWCWSQIYMCCFTDRIKEGFGFRITRLAHCIRNELVITSFFQWSGGTICILFDHGRTQLLPSDAAFRINNEVIWSVKISGDEDTSTKVFFHLSGTKTKSIWANLSGDQGGPPITPASLKVTCFDTGFWNNVLPMWRSCAKQNSTNRLLFSNEAGLELWIKKFKPRPKMYCPIQQASFSKRACSLALKSPMMKVGWLLGKLAKLRASVS